MASEWFRLSLLFFESEWLYASEVTVMLVTLLCWWLYEADLWGFISWPIKLRDEIHFVTSVFVANIRRLNDFRFWWQNHYVDDFFGYVGYFLNVLNRSSISWISHNTFDLQHQSPTSMWSVSLPRCFPRSAYFDCSCFSSWVNPRLSKSKFSIVHIFVFPSLYYPRLP